MRVPRGELSANHWKGDTEGSRHEKCCGHHSPRGARGTDRILVGAAVGSPLGGQEAWLGPLAPAMSALFL